MLFSIYLQHLQYFIKIKYDIRFQGIPVAQTIAVGGACNTRIVGLILGEYVNW